MTPDPLPAPETERGTLLAGTAPRHRPPLHETTRASGGSPGGAAVACCEPRSSVRGAERPRRGAGALPSSRATRCPVSGCDGGVPLAAPPPGLIRASSASSEEGPRASTPSVLRGHRHRQALSTLLAPPAEQSPAPSGAHARPKSVLVHTPAIARLIRSLHAKNNPLERLVS
jgi:hypothetical protein